MTTRAGTALITGAAKRLGRAMALALAAQGYDIALHYNGSEAEALELKPALESFGATVHLLQADLRDMQAVRQLVPQAIDLATAPLNVLINNASAFFPKPFAETDTELLDLFFDLHLKAPFLLTQAFAAHCQTTDVLGNVVNLTDIHIQKNPTAYMAYILSKKSLSDFTALAAKTLGPQVRVNAIAPGHILEPVAGNEDQSDVARQKAPMRRTGNVEDITEALLSLLNNSYLTGQTLWVDGGLRL